LDGKIVAAVGPLQEGQHPAWTVYFKTSDADATANKVEAAGGKVEVPAFDVLGQGRMAIFTDPIGAFFAVWQPQQMPGLGAAYQANTFAWCELQGKDPASTAGFYGEVFGWTTKTGESAAEGAAPYVEWQIDGKSIGGAMDTSSMPGAIPPHWLVYFLVDDIK